MFVYFRSIATLVYTWDPNYDNPKVEAFATSNSLDIARAYIGIVLHNPISRTNFTDDPNFPARDSASFRGLLQDP